MNIAFIGFGNMAKAIAKGIKLNAAFESCSIYAYDPFVSEGVEGIQLCEQVNHATENAKYIFLCVKPQVMFEVLNDIKSNITSEHILVSIAAGIPTQKISQAIDGVCPVVRTMPNTPLMLGFGTTAIAKPDGIGDSDYKFVLDIFGCMGEVFEIPGDKFDQIIPVNGSSPAFIYQFAKVIASQAQKHGIEFDVALKMIASTFIGSAKMILESGIEIDELIDMVCSKKGTTIEGLNAMKQNGFETSIQKGFDRAVERSIELSK